MSAISALTPTLDRRTVVGVAGAGIASLVLPSATAAASTLGPAVQSGLPAYGPAIVGSSSSRTADTVLAHWDTFVSGSVAWEGSAGWRDATIRDVAALPDRVGIVESPQLRINTGSATYAGTDVPSPTAGTFSDVTGTGSGTGLSPYYTEFVFNTPGTTLSLSESPYLEWRIEAGAGYRLYVQSLVLHRVRRMGSNPVSLAFYASRDGFTGESVLLRTATLGTGLTLLSVSTEQVDLVTSSLQVRMYPYAMTAPETLRFRNYGYTGGVTALDPTRDSTDTTYQGTTTDFPDAMAAFIGQVLEDPIPPG